MVILAGVTGAVSPYIYLKGKVKYMIPVESVANYFLSLVDPDDDDCISNLKLQKLCYYAQGFYLALHGERLFDETLQAWQHGPVVPSLYRKYKDRGRSCLMPEKNFDINSIPQAVRDFLDTIYSYFGQFSAWKLRDMTHHEDPWNEAYNKVPNDEISDESLKRFFKTQIG